MNTQDFYTKTFVIFLLFALLLSGCAAPDTRTQATMDAVKERAREAVEGKIAAMGLVGSNSLQNVAPDLWAINKAVTSQPGAYMLLNDVQQLAVFIAPGGKTAAGLTYYFTGFIDVSKTAIVDANRQLASLGIDPQTKTLEEMLAALRSRGFTELTPVVAPTLVATLRLGLAFMKQLGTTISDVLIVPTFMFTPETLYPWCDGDNCQQIEQ